MMANISASNPPVENGKENLVPVSISTVTPWNGLSLAIEKVRTLSLTLRLLPL